MRLRSALLAQVLFLAAIPAAADQITFSFVASAGNSVDMTASALGGMQSGPADNIAVSDTTLGEHFAQPGTFTSSAGPASSFILGSSFVIGTFSAGGVDSVEIVNGSTVLVAGTMQNNGAFLAQYPGGAGSFLGTFRVTEVDPGILAEFGLSGFNPAGSVSFTFGQDQFAGKTLDAVVGGGTVTIVASPVSEPGSLGLLGLGLAFFTYVKFRRAELKRGGDGLAQRQQDAEHNPGEQ